MQRFSIYKTPIAGLQVIERKLFEDSRGYLERLFCHEQLADLTQNKTIRQINHTLTKKEGAARGMHFQYPPHAETKIVLCVKGRVWDVAVDLRRGSPTFLRHYGQELSVENCLSLLIPEGFAHGFQTLSTDCELLYFHTADYKPEFEGALNMLDPCLDINWPKPISECSERDANHPMLSGSFTGLRTP